MTIPLFLVVTLIAHACLAILVAAHARRTGRDAGNWPYLTLLFGVVGAYGYAVDGRTE